MEQNNLNGATEDPLGNPKNVKKHDFYIFQGAVGAYKVRPLIEQTCIRGRLLIKDLQYYQKNHLIQMVSMETALSKLFCSFTRFIGGSFSTCTAKKSLRGVLGRLGSRRLNVLWGPIHYGYKRLRPCLSFMDDISASMDDIFMRIVSG